MNHWLRVARASLLALLGLGLGCTSAKISGNQRSTTNPVASVDEKAGGSATVETVATPIAADDAQVSGAVASDFTQASEPTSISGTNLTDAAPVTAVTVKTLDLSRTPPVWTTLRTIAVRDGSFEAGQLPRDRYLLFVTDGPGYAAFLPPLGDAALAVVLGAAATSAVRFFDLTLANDTCRPLIVARGFDVLGAWEAGALLAALSRRGLVSIDLVAFAARFCLANAEANAALGAAAAQARIFAGVRTAADVVVVKARLAGKDYDARLAVRSVTDGLGTLRSALVAAADDVVLPLLRQLVLFDRVDADAGLRGDPAKLNAAAAVVDALNPQDLATQAKGALPAPPVVVPKDEEPVGDDEPMENDPPPPEAEPAPALVVVVPNGGESYDLGTSIPISWTPSTAIGPYDVDLSVDGGMIWTRIATDVTGTTLSWPVLELGSERMRVRVVADGGEVTDQSDGDFTIPAPSLTLTSPNGGEALSASATQVVTWTSAHHAANVDILYSGSATPDFQTVLAANVPNSGSRTVNLPSAPSNDARIAVRSTLIALQDGSDGPFALAGPPGGGGLEGEVRRDIGMASFGLDAPGIAASQRGRFVVTYRWDAASPSAMMMGYDGSAWSALESMEMMMQLKAELPQVRPAFYGNANGFVAAMPSPDNSVWSVANAVPTDDWSLAPKFQASGSSQTTPYHPEVASSPLGGLFFYYDASSSMVKGAMYKPVTLWDPLVLPLTVTNLSLLRACSNPAAPQTRVLLIVSNGTGLTTQVYDGTTWIDATVFEAGVSVSTVACAADEEGNIVLTYAIATGGVGQYEYKARRYTAGAAQGSRWSAATTIFASLAPEFPYETTTSISHDGEHFVTSLLAGAPPNKLVAATCSVSADVIVGCADAVVASGFSEPENSARGARVAVAKNGDALFVWKKAEFVFGSVHDESLVGATLKRSGLLYSAPFEVAAPIDGDGGYSLPGLAYDQLLNRFAITYGARDGVGEWGLVTRLYSVPP